MPSNLFQFANFIHCRTNEQEKLESGSYYPLMYIQIGIPNTVNCDSNVTIQYNDYTTLTINTCLGSVSVRW